MTLARNRLSTVAAATRRRLVTTLIRDPTQIRPKDACVTKPSLRISPRVKAAPVSIQDALFQDVPFQEAPAWKTSGNSAGFHWESRTRIRGDAFLPGRGLHARRGR